jgi:hypothetical protein
VNYSQCTTKQTTYNCGSECGVWNKGDENTIRVFERKDRKNYESG